MGVKKQWSLEKGEKVQKMYDDQGRSFKAQISRNFWANKKKAKFFVRFLRVWVCVAAVFIFSEKVEPM